MVLQPQLEEAARKTAVLAQEFAEKADAAEKVQVVVQAEEKDVSEKTAEAERMHREAEEELVHAEPEMRKAQDALNDLDKGAIAEVRALMNPVQPIRVACEAVMILLDEKPGTFFFVSSLDLSCDCSVLCFVCVCLKIGIIAGR